MAKRCFWITLSPEVGTYLYSQSPREDTLNVWPALPRFIQSYGDHLAESVDSVIAVPESATIVCQINIMGTPTFSFGKGLPAMQESFPEPII